MYTLVLIGLIAAGIALAAAGWRRQRRGLVTAGLLLVGATLLFFGLLSFWGEMLWFEHVGFARRFWTQVLAQIGVAIALAVFAAVATWLLTLPTRRHAPRARWIGALVAGVVGGLWGAASWSIALQWLMGVTTGTRDPVLGMDTSFYLFSLPFYDAAVRLLALSALIALLVAAWSIAVALHQNAVDRHGRPAVGGRTRFRSAFVALGGLALVLAAERLLAPYHLMYSRLGAVYGAGWTDVHVRMPAYYVTAAALVASAVFFFVPRATEALARRLEERFGAGSVRLGVAVASTPLVVVGAIWLLGSGVLPGLSQWLLVQPNELAREREYLRHNIEFTRAAFGLGDVEIQEFSVEGELTPEVARDKERLLSEVRLWDPRALDDVLEQFQELRLYYEVTNVDLDRYRLDGRYRQVMVAPREMQTNNLPAESQTFVNRHFKYTHGYGMVMSPVSDFTPAGLPELVVRDVPPVSLFPSVQVKRPEIYFGELTTDYVVANSRAPEFDYPAGGANVYVHYEGTGGVPLDNFWRKLVYGWKLGGTRLLFSEYPKADSRILFHRNISERVATIAPFLELDHDPYTVLVDGRIKWIVDAYTTSTSYPYSEPFSSRPRAGGRARAKGQAARAEVDTSASQAEIWEARRLEGVNYARNSVKAVVDAYDGSVSLYVFDPRDPIVRVWSRVYPGMFRSMEEMPAELRAHVRYPEALLHAQGAVFARYHMTDPVVFYNQEDLWVRATEKYYDEIRPVEPYYVMWQAPGSNEVEFILMQPFTPKNRQVLIGWLAGMCDGANYGKIVAYRFPKDKWVLGPQQVDTKIDQAPRLSAQLTLWDQHGKRVIRGNVLAIPIAQTILYVEPIYIQAQTAAYPELRMVVLMHGDEMSYAPTFEQALEGLVSGAPATPLAAEPLTPVETVQRANRAFDEYLRLMNEGQFAEAGKQLEILRDSLRKLQDGGALPSR
jgi:hypothetical protein